MRTPLAADFSRMPGFTEIATTIMEARRQLAALRVKVSHEGDLKIAERVQRRVSIAKAGAKMWASMWRRCSKPSRSKDADCGKSEQRACPVLRLFPVPMGASAAG